MLPSRIVYDTPEHGAEVAVFAILVMIFAVAVGIYNLDHRMPPETCRQVGIMSCSNIVIREQDTPTGRAVQTAQLPRAGQ